MIYFLVFAYNEEDNIVPALEKIGMAMNGLGHKYRVFVVDDGSTDGTVSRIGSIGDKVPVAIVRNPKNMGVASAFTKGIEAIRLTRPGRDDAVITWEGDNTMNPDAIGDMIARWEKVGGVICTSRFMPGGRGYRIFSLRYLLSKAVNLILRLRFPVEGSDDYTHFPRLYPWSDLEKTLARYGDRFIESGNFAFNVEALLKVRETGAHIEQVPHHFQFDLRKGTSKLSIGSRVADYFRLMRRGIG